MSCFHPLPKYCQKPAHTREVQNQILLRNLNILLHKSHSINFSRKREVGKKNLSQESHGGNVVRSVKFLFSALPHSLSKPFLFWKSPTHRGTQGPSCCSCGPRVSLHNLLLFLTFSSIWPSPNWPAAGFSAHLQLPNEPRGACKRRIQLCQQRQSTLFYQIMQRSRGQLTWMRWPTLPTGTEHTATHNTARGVIALHWPASARHPQITASAYLWCAHI